MIGWWSDPVTIKPALNEAGKLGAHISCFEASVAGSESDGAKFKGDTSLGDITLTLGTMMVGGSSEGWPMSRRGISVVLFFSPAVISRSS